MDLLVLNAILEGQKFEVSKVNGTYPKITLIRGHILTQYGTSFVETSSKFDPFPQKKRIKKHKQCTL